MLRTVSERYRAARANRSLYSGCVSNHSRGCISALAALHAWQHGTRLDLLSKTLRRTRNSRQRERGTTWSTVRLSWLPQYTQKGRLLPFMGALCRAPVSVGHSARSSFVCGKVLARIGRRASPFLLVQRAGTTMRHGACPSGHELTPDGSGLRWLPADLGRGGSAAARR